MADVDAGRSTGTERSAKTASLVDWASPHDRRDRLPARDERLASTLSDLAALAQSSSGLDEAAEQVVALAKDNLECDFAGITVGERGGRLDSFAVTDPIVEEGDRLQYQLREGPCVDALWEQQDYVSEDIAHDPRWPRWGPAAAELGLVSVLAAKMSAEGQRIGALNLYSSRRRHFTVDEVAFAHLFAQQAAAALSSVRRVEQLMVAIDGRTLIGQAQGMLMERFGLDTGQAFDVLRRYSQDHNVKLRVVAEELVSTRALPPTENDGP